jgi:hypothetical protein
MVYGLNIVSANEFLYGAEKLDGNFSAIRSIDQAEDGGVDCESVSGGRRCHTEHFPSRMRWKGPKGPLIGDFNQNGLLNVSVRGKAFIEQFEPGIHQFVPVDYVTKEGDLLEKRYFWVVCNRIDSIDRDKTTFISLWGKIWRSIADVARDYPEDLPEGTDPKAVSKFVFSLSAIGSAHVWRDQHDDLGGVWLSREFGDALKDSDLTGHKLPDLPQDAV